MRSRAGTTPGVDRSQERRAVLLSYFGQRGRPGSLLTLSEGLKATRSTPAKATRQRPKAKRTGSNPTDIDTIARFAKRMGLNVGEHPKYGGVGGGHVAGTYHKRRARKSPGAALDVSGPPDKLARFNKEVARRYGRDLEELFHDPGKNIKRGKKTKAIGGHGKHVHVADID